MNNQKKTIVFAAGGTGGHIFPALTVARSLVEIAEDCDILFIGGGGELEKRLMSSTEFEYHVVKSTGVVGKGITGTFNFLKNLLAGAFKLKKLYREKNVSFVIGFGGYPTVIPVLIAAITRTPIFIFEQNGIAGLANKFLANFAKKIFTVPISKDITNSFKKFEDVTIVLNPVRPEIKQIQPWVTPQKDQPLRILVIGGSQGAKSLNGTILELRDFFINQSILLTHQTGKLDFQRIETAYEDQSTLKAIEFIDDMQASLSSTDLIICRAGAGTVSEITITKIPTIFVPLPISNGHQKFNALHLVEGKAVKMYSQDQNLAENLRNFILEANENRKILEDMNKSFISIPELIGVEDGAKIVSQEIYSSISIQNNGL